VGMPRSSRIAERSWEPRLSSIEKSARGKGEREGKVDEPSK
jgi:hypothetical protein